MTSKGYVVRGKRGSDGAEIAAWTHDGGIGSPVSAAQFRTPGQACGAADALTYRGCSDVAIFRVLDDGREERLPSYEEALALLDGATSSDAYLANVSTQLLATMRENDRLRAIEPADPIAALEAAERRLLEAGGWREMAPSGKWIDGVAGLCESRVVALTIARLAAKGARARLAAKGGA